MSVLPELERQLAEAARRTHPRARAGHQPHGLRRVLVALAAAIVVCGTATAAVLVGGGRPSPPLAGTHPGDSGSGARRYRLVMSPDTSVGQIGWCWRLQVAHGRQPVGAGVSCGPVAAPGTPVVADGALWSDGDGTIRWAIVTADVAVVRWANSAAIAPRPDPSLPDGWRAAIGFASGRHELDAPLRVYDAADRLLSQADARRAGTDRAGSQRRPSTEMAKAATTGTCLIRPRRGADVGIIERRVLLHPLRPSRVDAQGRPLLTCGSGVFLFGHHVLRAAVLVDARHPHAPAAPLPPDPAISARRVHGGWLVVVGSHVRERTGLLERLDVSL